MEAPLAHRIRPTSLEEFTGQNHIVGEGKPLRRFVERGVLPQSIIFWGPPGTGKTTLAHILAESTDSQFIQLSAVDAGKKDLKKAVNRQHLAQQRVVLFLDEIHRFNKAQQDFLLPYVENGTLTLIGATTENPSFEVNNALLSRSQVYTLKQLSDKNIEEIIQRGKNVLGCHIEKDAVNPLVRVADGDARQALNTLSTAHHVADGTITKELIQQHSQQTLSYDKDREEHFNLISALHKSLRDSDVQASVYWLMRMLNAGEDPLYVTRRMVRFASEDIGNADPDALRRALDAKEAVQFLGMPECKTALVQVAVYLAKAPKSNAAYRAVKKTENIINETGSLPVPKVIRNAPTEFMKDEGYGEGYVYAHDDEEKAQEQQHLPTTLENEEFHVE